MRKSTGILAGLAAVGLSMSGVAPASAAPASVEAVQVVESDPSTFTFAVTNHGDASAAVYIGIEWRPSPGQHLSASRVVSLAPGESVNREYIDYGGAYGSTTHYVVSVEFDPSTGAYVAGKTLDRDRVAR